MQSVDSAFTAEEKDVVRKVAGSLLVSWKKDYISTIRPFTIGVSLIGGNDGINSDGGVLSDWNKYVFANESDYLLNLAYERFLAQPTGGLVKALAEVRLENTSTLVTTLSDGYSIDFASASSQYIDCGNAANLQEVVNFTLTAWIKPVSATAWGIVLGKDVNDATRGWSFGVYPTSGKVYFEFPEQVLSTTSVTTGWQHIAVTISNTTVKFYLNGTLDGTSAITGNANCPTSLTIGRRNYPASEGYFNGLVDGVRFYNSTLNATDITADYNNTPSRTTLVSEWLLNEGSGITATDTQGSNDGTLTNSPTYSTDVPTIFVDSVSTTSGSSGRFLPNYLGGDSELFTSVSKPRRPVTINAGFNYSGIDQMIPQFIGITTKSPKIDIRNKTIDLNMADFVDFLQNRYLDQQVMFTGQRVDQVIDTQLVNLGYATAQYELDPGINIIPFGLFEKGTKLADMFDKLVKAENGHFYQDEEGRLRFENRQHWDSSPHNTVQKLITTGMVINSENPTTDHIINTVEVKSKPRAKQPLQLVFTLQGTKDLEGSSDTEIFVNFDDPMLSLNDPVYTANSASDGTGSDMTSSISVKEYSKFAKAAKIVLTNNSGTKAYLTAMTIYGRPAKIAKDIYVRLKDQSSVTAFEERPLVIDNDYIQDESWANSLAQMLLNDYGNPEAIQILTVRAIPELQLGDMISWQGRYWRVFGIKIKLNPSEGFVQELKLLQRTITTYFRIGISLIGSSDRISP